ncbi:MAG: hypothetical protein IT547_06520 [Hyphomonadaceae bacterium]|nr:hypothetical protein [Hyphomonadaceae bacterium]
MKPELWKLTLAGDGAPLIVAFNAKGIAPGRFSPYRALQNVGCSILYLNCEADSWYLDIWDDVLRKIQETKDALRPSRVLYTGFSMGAYASLRAHCVDPDAMSLSFSPEFKTGVPLMFAQWRPKHSIEDCLAEFTGDRMEIIFGRYEVCDAHYYARSLELGLTPRLMPWVHATMPLLISMGVFNALIDQMLDDRPLLLPFECTDAPEARHLYDLFSSYFYNRPYVGPEFDVVNHIWNLSRARVAALAGDFELAQAFVEKARLDWLAAPGRDIMPDEREANEELIKQFKDWLAPNVRR